QATLDVEDKTNVQLVDKIGRVLHGGSFLSHAVFVRSAARDRLVPITRFTSDGFRAARTLPLGSFTALPPTPEGGRNGKCIVHLHTIRKGDGRLQQVRGTGRHYEDV